MRAKTFSLPAGAVCQRGGAAFMLMTATLVECQPNDWPLVREGFQPGPASTEQIHILEEITA